MTDETLSPFSEWAEAHGITLTSEQLPHRTDGTVWGNGARHYLVTLTGPNGSLTTQYTQGSAYVSPPDVGGVLFCLASDARGIEDVDDFEEWAELYGLDTDSQRAEATYRTCQRLSEELARALGKDVFDELLELEEGDPSPYLTDDELRDLFRAEVLPLVIEQYGADDEIAIDTTFNDWTDELCKEGRITSHQYNTITLND